jgi:hypothetical protein
MFRLSARLRERAEALASSCPVFGLRGRMRPALLLFDLVAAICSDRPLDDNEHARDADQPPGRGQGAHYGRGNGKSKL